MSGSSRCSRVAHGAAWDSGRANVTGRDGMCQHPISKSRRPAKAVIINFARKAQRFGESLMAGRFECPGCRASLAYSAALAGRTVRCHHCQHSFEVASSQSRALCPPPLPKRKSQASEDLPVATVLTDAEDNDDVAEMQVDQTIDERPTRRSPLTSAILGLLSVYFFTFVVLASGVSYAVWSDSKRMPVKTIDPVAPPIETPVDYEQPKSLREVLNEGSKDNGARKDPPNVPRQPRMPGGPPRP